MWRASRRSHGRALHRARRPAPAWGAPRRRWRRPNAWRSCPPPPRRSAPGSSPRCRPRRWRRRRRRTRTRSNGCCERAGRDTPKAARATSAGGCATPPPTSGPATPRSSADRHLRTWTRRRGGVLRGLPHHPRRGGADAGRARGRDRAGVQGGAGRGAAGAASGLRRRRAGGAGVCGVARANAAEAQGRDPGAGGPRGAGAGPHRGGRVL